MRSLRSPRVYAWGEVTLSSSLSPLGSLSYTLSAGGDVWDG